jgi:hypothetical protein
MEIKEKNELALRRLRLAETYATLMKNVEQSIDEYRYYLSKTKAVIGFSMASSCVIDLREIEPTTT